MFNFSDVLAISLFIVLWHFGHELAKWLIRAFFVKIISKEVEKYAEYFRNGKEESK